MWRRHFRCLRLCGVLVPVIVGGGGDLLVLRVVLGVRDMHVVLQIGLARRVVVALRADHARVPTAMASDDAVVVTTLSARNPQLDGTGLSRIFIGPSRIFGLCDLDLGVV